METAKPIQRSWVVCERGERWYRAVCRFASGDRKENLHFHIDRVLHDSPNQVAAVARARLGNVFVVWEFQSADAAEVARLDSIAMLRADWPQAIQLAFMPSNCPLKACLAAQEAGVQFLIRDLSTLQMLVPKLTARTQCRL